MYIFKRLNNMKIILKLSMSVALSSLVVHASDIQSLENNYSFYSGTHTLVSPFATIKNFDRLSQAVYNATTEELLGNCIQAIRTFCE